MCLLVCLFVRVCVFLFFGRVCVCVCVCVFCRLLCVCLSVCVVLFVCLFVGSVPCLLCCSFPYMFLWLVGCLFVLCWCSVSVLPLLLLLLLLFWFDTAVVDVGVAAVVLLLLWLHAVVVAVCYCYHSDLDPTIKISSPIPGCHNTATERPPFHVRIFKRRCSYPCHVASHVLALYCGLSVENLIMALAKSAVRIPKLQKPRGFDVSEP